jgi:hypothetical protein
MTVPAPGGTMIGGGARLPILNRSINRLPIVGAIGQDVRDLALDLLGESIFRQSGSGSPSKNAAQQRREPIPLSWNRL